MENQIRALFARYEAFFRHSLAGDFDRNIVADLYAPVFIESTPAGLMTGRNDGALLDAMVQGYEYYREIGTRDMRMRGLRISAIDENHSVAHVAWSATYARDDLPETIIDFEVHYLVRLMDGSAKVFGWMSGDEQAVLKARGVI